MVFLRTILIILLIYYLLKILVRWLAPRFFAYLARKVETRFQETFTNNGQQGSRLDDLKQSRKKNKVKSSQKIGEYIDFEEID
jgi:uncharacterized protein involved in cysteine biosynthesis